MTEMFLIIAAVIPFIVAMKAILIGSDFSFVYWYRHGQRYINWYNFLRPTFEDYLTEQKVEEFK